MKSTLLKTILFGITLVWLSSCNTNHGPDREKLLQVSREYIQTKLTKDMRIDSCYITNVDTFTAAKEAGVYITMKSDSLRSLGALQEALMKKLKANTEVVRLSYKVSKDLGDKDKESLFSDTTEINAIMATRMRLGAEIDSLNKLRTEGRFDVNELLDYRTELQLCVSDNSGKQICNLFVVLITKDYKVEKKFGQ